MSVITDMRIIILNVAFLSFKYIGTVSNTSMISSHIISESWTIHKLLLTPDVLLDICTHISIYCYSTFDLNYIFHHQVRIFNHMKYVSLMFLVQLFLLSHWRHLIFHLLFSSSSFQILPDGSSRVSQLPLHLSNLAMNKY